jgi:hypothetical protein
MSENEAEGIILVDAWERANQPGFLGGKPTHAVVGPPYRIEDQGRAESVLTEAAAFAKSQGWRMQEDVTVSTLFTASKPLPPGGGRLGLALGAVDPVHDPDGPRVLNILLDFGSVWFHDTTTSTPRRQHLGGFKRGTKPLTPPFPR